MVRKFCSVVALLISISLPGCGSEEAAPDAATENAIRVEPPHWWTGFVHSELQLMVHYPDVGRATAQLDHPGVQVSRVERGDSDNYIFVYLDIAADAAAGPLSITLETGNNSVVVPFELRERDRTSGRHTGFSSEDVIYLLMPDRFANGNPDNDTLDGYEDGLNRDDPYGRHGGDIAGIAAHLPYIADMGFTQIWINPLLENAMSGSYHGYAATDYYKVDPRFGSNDDYAELVSSAREKGIGIIMDMVANHIGSNHWWMQDLPSDDWLNNPLTRRSTSHARTSIQDPYASEFDRAEHADGWFADAMPDLNQRNPLLADYLIQNSIWWVEELGLSGIRQDTWPYPDKHFSAEWARRIMAEYPDFNIVGEEWSPSPAIVAYWQVGNVNHDGYVPQLPTLMDFPLQIKLAEALKAPEPPWGSVWTPVYEMLGHDFLYPDPMNLLIFADNHDMSRIFTQLDEDDDLYRMAIVFYLTMRGIPQIYYGTEIQMTHPGTESHGAIRAEFPGGWPDHERNAFTGTGLTEQQSNAQALLRQLLNWRKQKPVIHHGQLMQYAPVGNVYAYFRYDKDDTVMVLFNRGAESASIDTARFAERLGVARTATDVLSGREIALDETIEIDARSVLLLEVLQ